MWRRLATAVVFFFACGLTTVVQADGPGDGVYGRFDGTFALSVGLGGGASWADGGGAEGNLVGELRLRIVDAAGPFAAVGWGPEGSEHVVVGVELRPFFPSLFLLELFTGNELVDLLLQSIGVEIGAAVTPLGDGSGVGWSAGMGLEVPLVLPSRIHHGLWLRLGMRRVRAKAGTQGGPDAPVDEWNLYATFAVKTLFGGRVGRWEPRRYHRR